MTLSKGILYSYRTEASFTVRTERVINNKKGRVVASFGGRHSGVS